MAPECEQCPILHDQLSYALARILELEVLLEESRDTNRRLRDGDQVEWDYEGWDE
jgi:hypothetical protein